MNRLEKLKEAKSIIDQYAQKCSTIDEGNLYFAATQFEFACAEYEKIIAELEGALDKIGHDTKINCDADDAENECFDVTQVALQKLKEFRG